MGENSDPQVVTPESMALAAEMRPLLGQLFLLLRRAPAYADASPTQITAMALLLDGSRRMHELCADTGVTGPSMTVLVDRMERQGWVRRMPEPADRRVVRVALTAEGRETVLRTQAIRTALLAERLAGLSEDERQSLRSALPALAALLDQ